MRGSGWRRVLRWSKPPGWARWKVPDEYPGRPNACMNWSTSPQISESKPVPPASAIPTTVQRSPPNASSAPSATPLNWVAMLFPTTTSCVPNWKGRPWTMWTLGRSSSARGDTPRINALGNVSIRGVSPRALELRPKVHIVQGRPFQFGTHEVVVGKSIATQFKGVALGAELAFGGDRWTVVGIADAGGTGFDSEIWGDVDQFMQAFGRPVYASLTFRLADPGQFDQLKARLQADPRLQYVELKHERDYYKEQSQTLAKFIRDRKSTRLNSSHLVISYAVFCLKKKKKKQTV